jgi:hypothetical protein
LNSAFIQDRAAAFASLESVVSAKTDEDRVRVLYERAYSRAPHPDELKLAVRYLDSQIENSKTIPWQRLAHVLLAANEFVFVD